MTNPVSIPADAPAPADANPTDPQIDAAANSLLKNMPPQVQDSFTPAQRRAIGAAITQSKTRDFLVNLRLSLFGTFLNIIIGRENRNPVRQAHERERHPLATPGNLAMLALIGTFGMTVGWMSYQFVVHGGL